MTASAIATWTRIDFDRDGKQIASINIEHSVTRSASGVVPVPIAHIKNGDGTSLLLIAGNHGNGSASPFKISLRHQLGDGHNLDPQRRRRRTAFAGRSALRLVIHSRRHPHHRDPSLLIPRPHKLACHPGPCEGPL